MKFAMDLQHSQLLESQVQPWRDKACEALHTLFSDTLSFTGWVKDPLTYGKEQIASITETAKKIRQQCDYFLVLGVGGSFMGAKAVIDMLPTAGKTKVLFAGYNFSGRYIKELLAEIEDKDLCLCVISKSGSTTETLSAYGIFKNIMIQKYGQKETAARTYVVTENKSNYLYDQATKEGCTLLYLPESIGGRYSVLTPVGLLPIAVAGIDIHKLLAGAKELASFDAFTGKALDYAISRQLLFQKNKPIEIFAFFDPYLAYFGEWLKQLFGESEGKDGKGIYPASLLFSRDLHSMGQFLQQGTAIFYETFITVANPTEDVAIPKDAMEPFAGKTIRQLNTCAEKGVLDAHVAAGTPIISIVLEKLDTETVGQLLYWFEMQCAVSALLSGVDPFNQPGVEAYKKEMRNYINQL